MNHGVCVILHGFTGNPWEVEPLAITLSRCGYQVETPLLPGHQLEKRRMEKASAADWVQTVERIVESAFAENKEVHLIGFSMGAMIAALVTARYPISTLVLLSPAVYVATPKVLGSRIKNFVQLAKENPNLLRDAVLQNVTSMRAAPLSNVLQFQKIVRQAKTFFSAIDIPVCVIHGQKDELVDPRSAAWIYQAVPSKEKELHYLENSNHLICRGCEVDTVNQIVLAFLEKHHG